MTFALKNMVSLHYRDHCEVRFYKDDRGQLSATIDTDRLHIESLGPQNDNPRSTEETHALYASLYGNTEVMEKFAGGKTKSPEDTAKLVNNWIKRWQSGDPFGGMAIYLKETGEFVGHIVLGHGDNPGESSLAGLGNARFWNSGYGTEAAVALVEDFAPLTVQEDYRFLITDKDGQVSKPLLNKIAATAKTDNGASVAILSKKLKMKDAGIWEEHGAPRHHFFKEISDQKSS
ncbi:MAG: GNAT family N-acetyltransferase [Chlamydiales bacterium]|nr:GNAT family N-acetyltransferase [Chlamydiales bacterium]